MPASVMQKQDRTFYLELNDYEMPISQKQTAA